MRDRKSTKIWIRSLALMLVIAMTASILGGCSTTNTVSASTLDDYSYESDEFISERISNNYSKVSKKYTYGSYGGEELVFYPGELCDGATTDTMGYTGAG